MGIPLNFLSNMSKKSSKKSSSKKSTKSSSSSSSRRSHRNFPGRYTYSVIGARDVPQGGYGVPAQQQFGSYAAPAVSGYGYPAQQQFAAPTFGGYGAYPQQQQFGTYQF